MKEESFTGDELQLIKIDVLLAAWGCRLQLLQHHTDQNYCFRSISRITLIILKAGAH